MLEVLYRHDSLVGLRFHPPPGRPKTLSFLSVCLFVCLSVTLLNVRVCAPDFTMKGWSTETVLIPLDRGRFVVVQSCPTFSYCCQLATSLNAEVQNMAKIGGGFSPPEGDRINLSRRNLARQRRPRVCYSTPNLALIGKRGSVQEPPKISKFAQKCVF